jgi:hypothetical protein
VCYFTELYKKWHKCKIRLWPWIISEFSLSCARESSVSANGTVRVHQVFSTAECAADWGCRKNQADRNNKIHRPLYNIKQHWIIQSVPRPLLNYSTCIKITTVDLIDDILIGWTLLILLCTKTFYSVQPCQISIKIRRFGDPLSPHDDDKLWATERDRGFQRFRL